MTVMELIRDLQALPDHSSKVMLSAYDTNEEHVFHGDAGFIEVVNGFVWVCSSECSHYEEIA